MSRHWNHFDDYHLCAIPEVRKTTGLGCTRAGEPADRLLNEPIPLQPPAGDDADTDQTEAHQRSRARRHRADTSASGSVAG